MLVKGAPANMLEQLTAANILNFRDVFRFSRINKLQKYLYEKISDLFVNNPVYTLMFMSAKMISIYWLLMNVLSDQVQIYWWERTLVYHKKLILVVCVMVKCRGMIILEWFPLTFSYDGACRELTDKYDHNQF